MKYNVKYDIVRVIGTEKYGSHESKDFDTLDEAKAAVALCHGAAEEWVAKELELRPSLIVKSDVTDTVFIISLTNEAEYNAMVTCVINEIEPNVEEPVVEE